MSIVFGAARQAGFVVSDLERALAFWTETLGIGPFYVASEITFHNFIYRGQPSASPIVSLAFAQSGGLQIELIQQHNDAPSAYREFLSSGREGMQHLSSWFDNHDAYDQTRATMLAQGMKIVHEVTSDDHSPRFVYFETGRAHAPLIELSEALLPGIRGVPDAVAAAAENWDRSAPIRYL